MMSAVDLASKRQTHAASLNTTRPDNNKPESTETLSSNQSADPPTANTLSPRQGDALLSLASRDDSGASLHPNKNQTSSVPTAHRAYQDTVKGALYEDEDENDEVDLPEISVGPGDATDGDGSAPGTPSDGGGGTAPVEGGPITPVQESSPDSSTTGTVTIADDVRVEQSDKTESGFALNWKDQENTRVGTPDNGAIPYVGDETAQRLNQNLLITGHGVYVHSGGKVLWVSPAADHYLSISYKDGNLNISSASTRDI